MKDFVKVLFFVVAGIFFISYVQDAGIGTIGFSNSGTPFSENTSYNYSYDTDGDGIVSRREYEHGELERIENEIERLRKKLAQTLAREQNSPFANYVYLSRGAAKASNPDKEYLEIAVSFHGNTRAVITGWKLQSLASDRTKVIGEGVPPERALSEKNKRVVVLKTGEKAYIVSGDPSSRKSFTKNTYTQSDTSWIVPLDEKRGLWGNTHDIILLFDSDGYVVDYISY